ncbi:MAG: hypothetical protein HY905_20705 [Deltaproteobacteria bacterium]|nr:hypothetical protein [Deltaproteobacteria bacterium]
MHRLDGGRGGPAPALADEPASRPGVMTPLEAGLRRRLAIPDDAARVLVFGESSHWDPNWLFTSEQYYRLRIRHIFEQVLDELEREPRRVFAIESMFFLQRFWQSRPDRRDKLRDLLNEGRLRLTGSGITTPDATLPDTEAILRDFLLGQEWLRENGITAEPRVAYLPDDFGCSPALPSILRAAGFDWTGITRIDGMYFVGTDYRRRSAFPLPGSSAELLLRRERTQDFVWRAPDGAEVLAHWNAFTYFQGDMLAHVGVIRWMGMVMGLPWRTRRHVARRIRGFVRQLGPQALTPYMFCPIGCDFNGPIRDLVGLLDRHNRTAYPETGVFAVNAGLDDYLALVEQHRERLPTLELDPNPYWMGFYSSRPEAKRSCNRITRKLVLAERLSAVDGGVEDELRKGWDLVVLSNHHDFITGTSPDRVWEKEQRPALEEAERQADRALEKVERRVGGAPISGRHVTPLWTLEGGRLEVRSRSYRAVLDESLGGCFTSLLDGAGRERLEGPGNDLVVYRESGGLWRMGHEYRGGRFRERLRASEAPARIVAEERDGLLEVRIDSELAGRAFRRWLWFREDTPVVRMRLEGAARRRSTIACRFSTRLRPEVLAMDVPGGVAVRPRMKLHEPTFWPGRSWVHVMGPEDGTGLAAFLGGPATAALDEAGAVEWVALRNAPRELAWGFLPVASHPAGGLTDEATVFNYAVFLTETGDWRANHLPRLARQVLHRAWLFPGQPDLDSLADGQLSTGHGEVLVTAIKRAQRGSGLIVRLHSYAAGAAVARLSNGSRPVRRAVLCDARERDLAELSIDGGTVVVPVDGAIASVRLEFGERASSPDR